MKRRAMIPAISSDFIAALAGADMKERSAPELFVVLLR
jgi:hypothetical protein